MAKRFISFLGVSPYTPCNYLLDDQRVNAVRFVQNALLQLVADDFGADDSILIGCTAKARANNLDALCAEISASGWTGPPVTVVDLPDATSEEEMWTVFQTLMEQVQNGDELVFDITHSFRSLPMLFTVLIQYLGVVKRTRLLGVYYGAFERLGNAREVEAMPMPQRDAPIIDLTPFLSLYDWGAATDHFLRFGQTGELQALVDGRIKPILKATRGQDDSASALRNIVSDLARFATAVQYARGKELSEIRFQSRIVEPLRRVGEDFLPPLQPVLAELADRFREWPDADPANGLRAVGWCIDHGMVQQGITLLQETLVEILVARCQDLLAPVGSDREDAQSIQIKRRTLVSKLLNVLGSGKTNSEGWRDELADYRQVAETCAERLPAALPDLYRQLTQLRNDVNHAGFINAQSPDGLRRGLKTSYAAILDALYPPASDQDAASHAATRTFFVSRHPGAREWAALEGIAVDLMLDHLEIETIRPGDTVIGSLPVNLAFAVCERGARYLHLSLDLPAELRGRELDVAGMRACGARLEPYLVCKSVAHGHDAPTS